MLNLIKMDMYRLFKTKSYKFGLLISLVISFASISVIAAMSSLITMSGDEDIEGLLFLMPYSDWLSGVSIFTVMLTATTFLSLMICCIISSNFINEEQAGGYIKNIAGRVKSKGMLVLSKLVVIAVICLTVMVAYIVGSGAAAVLFLGEYINYADFGSFFAVISVRYILYLAINSIVLFLCTLTKSKSLAIAFGIVFGSGLTRVAYSILATFIDIIFKVSIPISSLTPDGTVFAITADSAGSELTKALAIGVVYLVAFLFLSSTVLKKRDTK